MPYFLNYLYPDSRSAISRSQISSRSSSLPGLNWKVLSLITIDYYPSLGIKALVSSSVEPLMNMLPYDDLVWFKSKFLFSWTNESTCYVTIESSGSSVLTSTIDCYCFLKYSAYSFLCIYIPFLKVR